MFILSICIPYLLFREAKRLYRVTQKDNPLLTLFISIHF